jgi:hypothetical protein
MQRYQNVAYNGSTNQLIPTPTINVFLPGTTTNVTIYSDEGVTSKANPFSGDAFGRYDFYVANGDYDIRVEGAGVSAYTLGDVSIFDARTHVHGVGGVTAIVLDTPTATIDIVNTTTETDLYNFSVPGATLGTTGGLRLHLLLDYLNNTGSNRQATIRIYLGSTLICTFTDTMGFSADRAAMIIEAWVFAKGATNSQIGMGRFMKNDPGSIASGGGTAGTTRELEIAGNNAMAEDSTAARTLRVSWAHSAADALLSVRRLTARLEPIR